MKYSILVLVLLYGVNGVAGGYDLILRDPGGGYRTAWDVAQGDTCIATLVLRNEHCNIVGWECSVSHSSNVHVVEYSILGGGLNALEGEGEGEYSVASMGEQISFGMWGLLDVAFYVVDGDTANFSLCGTEIDSASTGGGAFVCEDGFVYSAELFGGGYCGVICEINGENMATSIIDRRYVTNCRFWIEGSVVYGEGGEVTTLTVFDIKGRNVGRSHVGDGVDIEMYPSGKYFVIGKGNSGTATGSVVYVK